MYSNKRSYFNAFFSDTSPSIEPQIKKTKKSKPLDLSQTPLLDKINTFLIEMGRKNSDGTQYQINSNGYCHGLTLLFLEKMAEGNVQWFYKTNRKIIESKDSQLEEIELDIEKFLAMMEWAQNSQKYTNGTIRYSNIDAILDTQPQQSFDKLYTSAQLQYFFTYKQGKGNMICITNCYGDKKEHTVGIFTDGIQYHLYDSNYKHGQAVSYTSSKELTKEVLNRLYSNFDEAIPVNAELEIKMVHPISKKDALETINTHSTYNHLFNRTNLEKNEIQSERPVFGKTIM